MMDTVEHKVTFKFNSEESLLKFWEWFIDDGGATTMECDTWNDGEGSLPLFSHDDGDADTREIFVTSDDDY